MCGIAGIVNLNASMEELNTKIKKMQSTLIHRGPDDEGVFLDPRLPVALGHRRLAIIDPEQAKQPMSTQDKQLTLIFNGAIYNYLELREQLIEKGHPIQSHSDTEVLLYAYREWGKQCVDHLLGMFAFAIWDQANRTLFCARDRIGIKPFYYYFNEQQFVFASEIKAILAEGSLLAQTNSEGLKDYLSFQFCLDEKTLFKHIVKLQPGHYLTLEFATSLKLTITPYWDVAYDIDHHHDEAWFIENLKSLIEDAVRLHLRADVSLGAHLSGGLDSSTIVSHAARYTTEHRLKTFTGAFACGPEYDETAYAKQVAQKAGAHYHEIYIPENEFSRILPQLIYIMDEPTAGPGLIPQFYVSQLAAKHVKVLLGGQGGDEIFIGYARYMMACLEKALHHAISPSEQEQEGFSLAALIPHLPLLAPYKPMLQKFWNCGLFAPTDQRYFSLIDRRDEMTDLISQDLQKSDYCSFSAFQKIFNRHQNSSLINQMLYFDLKASLPALLQVEDRTSMAASIESRVPLLDHRIIELMARIPPQIKFSGGRMKHLFKEAVRHVVPNAIVERKDKMGFNTPFNQWTTGSAKEFIHDLLTSGRARQRGLYEVNNVITLLNNPQSGFKRSLWGIVCLELWHRIYIDGDYGLPR